MEALKQISDVFILKNSSTNENLYFIHVYKDTYFRIFLTTPKLTLRPLTFQFNAQPPLFVASFVLSTPIQTNKMSKIRTVWGELKYNKCHFERYRHKPMSIASNYFDRNTHCSAQSFFTIPLVCLQSLNVKKKLIYWIQKTLHVLIHKRTNKLKTQRLKWIYSEESKIVLALWQYL